MAVNTWNGSSSTDFATAANWTTTGETDRVPTAADDVIIPDTSSINKCDLDQARNINSFVLAPDGEFDQGGTLFIKGKNAAGEAVKCQGKLGDVSDFTVETQSAATVTLTKQSGAGDFRDIVITHADGVITLGAAATITRNLTITAGELNTDSSNDYALTVGGDTLIDVNGTLTLNASTSVFTGTGGGSWTLGIKGTLNGGTGNCTTRSFGTYANSDVVVPRTLTCTGNDSGYTFNTDQGLGTGSWDSNLSTVTITASSSQIRGAGTADAPFYNLIINTAGQTITVTTGRPVAITNNFTITAGTFNTDSAGASGTTALTVGTLGAAGQTGVIVDGTLTLNSSTCILTNLAGTGILNAPTTTITIRDRAEAGTYAGKAIDVDNMTVNNDLNIELTSGKAQDLDLGDDKIHDLTINNDTDARQNYMVQSGSIDGDLTITRGILNTFNRVLTVDGNCSIAADGKLEANVNGNVAVNLGSLTIASGGEYDATSATTTNSGSLENNGTYTHNDGIYKNDTSGSNIFGTSETTFYKIDAVARLLISVDTTVEHSIYNTGGSGQIRLNGLTSAGGMILTMGTSSVAGSINVGFLGMWNSNCTAKIYAADQLKPYTIAATTNWQFGVATGELWHLKWGDIDPNIITNDTYNNAKTITLDGDMEFDAVTVSGGDTLDLNEQRVNFGGYNQVVNDGTIDATNALMYLAYFGGTGTFTNDANTKVVYQNCDGSRGSWRFAQNTSGVSMLNDGRNHDLAHDTTIGKLIVGNTSATGFGLSTGGNEKDLTVTDLTIATGSKLVDDGLATGSVITCSGDFTTSGGLIGKSGLLFDGTNDYMRAGTYGVANNFTGWSDNNLTVEVWAKSSDSSQAGIMASRWGAGGSRQFILYQEANGSVRAAINSDGGSTYITTNGAEAGVSNSWTDGRDGKWHHYAMTYDGANLKLYIDGQLYANRATAVTLVNGVNSIFGIGAYNTNSSNTFSASGGFIGDIHRCSVWNHTLTESEIRGMMFYDYATMDADSDFNTPKGDLKGWYQFDEGKDSTIDNMQGTDNVDGLRTGATWAGAGTFTHGTSTLDMTDDGTIGIASGVTQFNNLKVAASGKTTTLAVLAGSSDIRFHGTLTHGGGTASSSGNPAWTMKGTSTVSAGSNWSNWYLCYWESSAAVPTATWKYWIAIGDNISLAGDMTCTGYFRPHQKVVSSGDYTITTYNALFHDNGGLNMGAGSLIFTHAQGLSDTTSSSVFTAGPGATVTGVAGKSNFKSQNNFSIVGKIENLDVTNEELKVTGEVINCTGDIHQYFPTIDHAQQLDADTADDRDVRLGRDLDKNTELINS